MHQIFSCTTTDKVALPYMPSIALKKSDSRQTESLIFYDFLIHLTFIFIRFKAFYYTFRLLFVFYNFN